MLLQHPRYIRSNIVYRIQQQGVMLNEIVVLAHFERV